MDIPYQNHGGGSLLSLTGSGLVLAQFCGDVCMLTVFQPNAGCSLAINFICSTLSR